RATALLRRFLNRLLSQVLGFFPSRAPLTLWPDDCGIVRTWIDIELIFVKPLVSGSVSRYILWQTKGIASSQAVVQLIRVIILLILLEFLSGDWLSDWKRCLTSKLAFASHLAVQEVVKSIDRRELFLRA